MRDGCKNRVKRVTIAVIVVVVLAVVVAVVLVAVDTTIFRLIKLCR